ncbi:hypothetical protein HZA41_02225, partial [Candidatus Peregrinibacteria bacterium]|nr:hypothetical protein [Candidatus Peregrinibacteria bacterium]
MFVANPREKDTLARGNILSTELRRVIFPAKTSDESQIATNLLTRTQCPIICVNTQWPEQAIQGWLERVMEHRPPSRLGIIGFGRIGFEAAKTILSSSYFAERSESSFPISQLGILNHSLDPLFRAKMLELEHIATGNSTQLTKFENEEDLFRTSDVVLFIVSDVVPSLTIQKPKQTDVRMVQFPFNLGILRQYLEIAKNSQFSGLFAIVSDPPDHLATAVNNEIAQKISGNPYSSERLGNHQLPAFSGLLNFSRAEWVIRNMGDENLKDSFRREGDVFGPHGQGLVVANARGDNFDPDLSRVVSQMASVANYAVRQAGKLPYDAPGVNLALGIIDILCGKDGPISLHIGNVTCGVRAKLHGLSCAFEVHAFDNAHSILVERVHDAANLIRSTTDVALGRDPETVIPMRPSAFWANRVMTGETLPTRMFPTCSGRDITSFQAVVVENHHFPQEQGKIFIPAGTCSTLQCFVAHAMDYLGAHFELPETVISGSGGEDSRQGDSVTEKLLSEKAGIIYIQNINHIRDFDLKKFQQKYPLFLQVDIAVDNPQNIDLIDYLVKQGGICLGFTPKTFSLSPKFHFGFIGQRVSVDQEMAEIPPFSTMTGYPATMNLFSDWQSS